jgi:hypothetical protein
MCLSLSLALIVSIMFHPTSTGLILVVSAALATGITVSVAGFSNDEVGRFVAVPLLAVTTFEAVLFAVQSATHKAIGYSLLHPGENLDTIDGLVRPQGTYDHVYEPTVVALVAISIGLSVLPARGRSRWLFLVAIGSASTTVALSHSRAALAGLVLIGVVAAVASARTRDLRLGVVVVAISFLVPALMTVASWQLRFEQSASELPDAGSGRPELVQEAGRLIAHHPIVGVGPRNYIDALDELEPYVEHVYAVHNVPILVTAELGIPAGFIFTVLLVATGWRAIVSGYRSRLVFLAVLPFLTLDILLYDRPFGLLLFFLWAGVATAFTTSGRHELADVAQGAR